MRNTQAASLAQSPVAGADRLGANPRNLRKFRAVAERTTHPEDAASNGR